MAARVNGVENEAHIVGTGNNRILLTIPDVYSGLESALGVTKLSGDPPAGVPATTVSAAIRQGICRKVKISFINAGGKRRTATLIVAAEKANQVLASLTGKSYRGLRIRTAYYPTRITLG